MSALTPRMNDLETKSPEGEEGKVLKYESGQYIYAHPNQLSTASGSAPSYAARAWVNFHGGSIVGGQATIRASANITSVTYFSAGHFRLNFTTQMPHANYAVTGTASGRDVHSSRAISIAWGGAAPTISNCELYAGLTGGSGAVGLWENPTYSCIAIFC